MENFLFLLIPLCIGWILDKRFGDPPGLPHLIVGFGHLIAMGEHGLNHGDKRFQKGAVMSTLLITGTFVLALVLCSMCSTHILLSGALGPRVSIIEITEMRYTSILPFIYLLFGQKGIPGIEFNPSDLTFGNFGFIYIPEPLNIASSQFWAYAIIAAVLVFYCLAGTSLIKEVREVFHACDRSLEEGRRQVARIVGRDTSRLSGQEVRTAALETLAENMSDGVVAPLFWYMLLGIPGMLTYKMINTLDSMIGYRNERYHLFGRFAAIIDDFANFIPARLTAVLMILVSGKWSLFPFVIKYGNKHLSPNSGYPEAALAGILNCRFGGPHNYFGEMVDKPYIGTNERTLSNTDMDIAIRNARYTEILSIIICIITLCIIYL